MWSGQCGVIRGCLSRRFLRVRSGSQCTLRISRLYVHSVVRALESHHVCYHSSFRQVTLVDADSLSTFGMNVLCSRNVGPVPEESAGIHLSHGFLEETQYRYSRQVVQDRRASFLGKLRRSRGSNKTSRVPSNASETAINEYGRTCSYPARLAVFQAVEEHRASNVNVVEQDGRFQDVHHLHLPATVKNWTGRVSQMRPQATQSTWVPLRTCDSADCHDPPTSRNNLVRLLCLRHYGLSLAQPEGGKELARQSVVRATAMFWRGTGSCTVGHRAR